MRGEGQDWLEGVAPGAGATWAPVLDALALRPTFEAAPTDAQAARYATEFSWRFGEDGSPAPGFRAAFALDPGRLAASWVPALMRRVAPGLDEVGQRTPWLGALFAARPAALQLGVDASRRVKWYAYPPVTGSCQALCRALDLPQGADLPVAFVALDLFTDGRVERKRYLAPPDRPAAAEALRARGAVALASRVEALPAAADSLAHALVLTERLDAAGALLDVTLHVRAEAAPGLAPPSGFAAVVEGFARAVPGLGLRVTHHAWLTTGERSVYAVARAAVGGTGSASPRSRSPASTTRT